MPNKGKKKNRGGPRPSAAKLTKRNAAKTAEQAIVARLEQKGSNAPRWKRAIGAAIPMFSQAAGSYLGGPEGASAGLAAGKLISAITGYGDYKVNKNSVFMGNSVPQFRQGGDGMKMCHREFIRDIEGSIDFELLSFNINPGLSTIFPFLSAIAARFEEYEMNGLLFEFRTTSGNAVSSTNASLGVVIMATDYDALNPLFLDKQQMESYEFSTSTVPSMSVMHAVECARNKNVLNNLYTRTGNPPAGSDVRLYDMGRFQIATQGQQVGGYTLGELWVTYDVTFKKPRLGGPFNPVGQGTFLHLVTNPGGSTDVFPVGGTGPFVRQDSTMNPDFCIWSTFDANALLFTRKGFYAITICSSAQTGGILQRLQVGPVGSNISADLLFLSADTSPSINLQEYISGQGFSTLAGNILVLDDGISIENEVHFEYNLGLPTTANFDLLLTYIGESVPPPPLVSKTNVPRYLPSVSSGMPPMRSEVSSDIKSDTSWVT